MTMLYIDCKKYAQEILDSVKAVPDKKKLVILTVGDDPASQSYVKGKIKDCEYCGIPYEHIKLPNEESSKTELAWQIAIANNSEFVGGIIVQLPLPEGFDEELYTSMVRFDKDVDGFHPKSPFKPCTPEGIMYLLHKELGSLVGKTALVIGRGKLVGAPVAKMLLDAGCTVIVAHSKTPPHALRLLLEELPDIVIAAAGKPGLVDLMRCYCTRIVIDCGVSRDKEGKLCGDCVGFDPDTRHWMRVTPVPGGVGLMTRAMLMKHMLGAEPNG